MIKLSLPHPINPRTNKIKKTDDSYNGSVRDSAPLLVGERAIGLLLILERSFVNAIAILIFDPNLISSVPLVRGNL